MNTRPEYVQFTTADHLLLPGLLYEPLEKTSAAVIHLHGNGSSSVFYDGDKNQRMADSYNGAGIAFFLFNNRGAHYVQKLTRIIGDEQERVLYGTAYEEIKECIFDINGAIQFLSVRGYDTFYLQGHSTGANKVCVYNYYHPQNPVRKYILLAGGDDTGLYHDSMGVVHFKEMLGTSLQKILGGSGRELVPKDLLGFDTLISYASLYDTIDPDGDYNIFPYNEYLNGLRLSSLPLFRHYQSLCKPTMVVYGAVDEYCYGSVPEVLSCLQENTTPGQNVTFLTINDADHGFHGKHTQLAKACTTWLQS
jgi:pimeloyl-ACP methyl ester carboxylesterase